MTTETCAVCAEWECRDCGHVRFWDHWETADGALVRIVCPECSEQKLHHQLPKEVTEQTDQ